MKWRKWKLTIQFRDKVVGGIPASPQLLVPWLIGRGVAKPVAEEMAGEIAKEILTAEEHPDIKEETKKAWTTFKADNDGLYLEERQLKAMLKETATTLRLTKKPGVRDAIAHGLFVKPEKVRLERNGAPLKEADGYDESVVHVMTRQGPRSAIKRCNYVEKATLSCDIWVAPSKEVLSEKDLKDMIELAQELGLGANRSQGYGKFDAEFQRLEGTDEE